MRIWGEDRIFLDRERGDSNSRMKKTQTVVCWSFFLDGWVPYLQWKQHHSALQKCILGLERVHYVGLPAKGRVLGKVRSLHPWERWIHRRNKNMPAFFLSFESYSLEWQARKAAEPGLQKQTFGREMEDGGNCGQLSPDWLDVVSHPANQGIPGPHSLWPSSTFHTFSLPPRWRKTSL